MIVVEKYCVYCKGNKKIIKVISSDTFVCEIYKVFPLSLVGNSLNFYLEAKKVLENTIHEYKMSPHDVFIHKFYNTKNYIRFIKVNKDLTPIVREIECAYKDTNLYAFCYKPENAIENFIDNEMLTHEMYNFFTNFMPQTMIELKSEEENILVEMDLYMEKFGLPPIEGKDEFHIQKAMRRRHQIMKKAIMNNKDKDLFDTTVQYIRERPQALTWIGY